MTQSAHTPGPWAACEDGLASWTVVDSDKEDVCYLACVGDEANACLIAESPTMHDLLLKLQAVRSPRELHNLRCEVDEVLARIEGV